MIFVLTVHWQSSLWVEPQLRFIRRNLPADTKVFAGVSGPAREMSSRFDLAVDVEGSHAENLNRLAAIALEHADGDDVLLFLDGDAFPVRHVDATLLAEVALCAIRRDENLGDPQPHPSFCMTTASFWDRIDGDWRHGPQWANAVGDRVTDVGARVLEALRICAEPWTPLLRTNRFDLHPIWFGVYGDVVYHHGAGFRPDDLVERADSDGKTLSLSVAAASTRTPRSLPLVRRIETFWRVSAARRRRARFLARSRNRDLSESVHRAIEHDDDFYRLFADGPAHASPRMRALADGFAGPMS